MTDTDLAALPSYIDREWLDGEHPTFYDTPEGRINRCTTCQEWSPCRVRTLFDYAQGVRVGDDGLVDRLREAARRAGLPHDVTVADIENLAREYAAQPAPSEAETLREYRRWGYAAGVEAALDRLRLVEPNESDHPGPWYDGWHAALDAVAAARAALVREAEPNG